MLDWYKLKHEDTWVSAKNPRIRISLVTDNEGNPVYRLYDSLEGLPGYSITWIGQEDHLTLKSAQREAEKLSEFLVHQDQAERELGRFDVKSDKEPTILNIGHT